MSKFQVADEAVIALWNSLAIEADPLHFSGNVPSRFLQIARGNFFRMLANFPQHVISGVWDMRTSPPGRGQRWVQAALRTRRKAQSQIGRSLSRPLPSVGKSAPVHQEVLPCCTSTLAHQQRVLCAEYGSHQIAKLFRSAVEINPPYRF